MDMLIFYFKRAKWIKEIVLKINWGVFKRLDIHVG